MKITTQVHDEDDVRTLTIVTGGWDETPFRELAEGIAEARCLGYNSVTVTITDLGN